MTAAMLAEPITLARACLLLVDDNWTNAQKLDGDRLLADFNGNFWNRNGAVYTKRIPVGVVRALAGATGPFVLDGELLDDGTYRVFDVVMTGKDWTLDARLGLLDQIFAVWQPGPSVQILRVATGEEAKRRLMERVLAEHAEGVVFKRLDSLYLPGRRSADWSKWKWVKTVDCVVIGKGRAGKDNLVLGCYDPADPVGAPVEVGEVTACNGDGPTLAVGDVCEVTYLSWTGTRLREPTRPRKRVDKRPEDCTTDQLVISRSKEILSA